MAAAGMDRSGPGAVGGRPVAGVQGGGWWPVVVGCRIARCQVSERKTNLGKVQNREKKLKISVQAQAGMGNEGRKRREEIATEEQRL